MSRGKAYKRPPNVNEQRRAIVMRVIAFAKDKDEAVAICRQHPEILRLCRKHRRTPKDFIRYYMVERAYRERAKSGGDKTSPKMHGVEDVRSTHVQRGP